MLAGFTAEPTYLELPAGVHADLAGLTAWRLGVVLAVAVVTAVFVANVGVAVALTADITVGTPT